MCGIVGAFDLRTRPLVAEQLIGRMTDTIAHRGPDDHGVYVSPGKNIGLGFRRLSIVDLSAAGHQPMSNDACVAAGLGVAQGKHLNSRVRVVFNGEIYNHDSLRSELEGLGHQYRSRSDTEALLHGYEEWGEGVVHRLRGIYAFAVYDNRRTDKLFLVRDRLGVKPLYHMNHAGTFLFASEIKALLEWPGVESQMDEVSMYHYLTVSASPAPRTMFQNVSKLAPGHSLSVQANGQISLRQYWSPKASVEGLDEGDEQEIVEQLRDKLRESVGLRMMSDVPFGVFLSGGLDSTLNVALMNEQIERPVNTFSVAIQGDEEFGELSYARKAAAHFRTNHHELTLTPQQFAETIPLVVHHQDEPLADPVSVPLYHVSKLAREKGISVVQVGEGADELFAGYAGYGQMADFYRRAYKPFSAMPSWIKNSVAAIAPFVLPDRRVEYIRRAAAGDELFWGGAVVFTESDKKRLLRNGFPQVDSNTHKDVIAKLYEGYDKVQPDGDFLGRLIHMELRHRLPELLLMRVDKMCMATSVEARVPYLDHELVTFALSIPSSLKYRHGQTKYILKQAARGILPDEVIDRKKVGFCGSARNMMIGPVLNYASEVIQQSDWIQGQMDMEYVNKILHEHKAQRRDHGPAVWCLMNLALWHKKWVAKEPLAA